MARLTRPVIVQLLAAAIALDDDPEIKLPAKARRDLKRGIEWLRGREAGPASKEKEVPMARGTSAADAITSDDGQA